MLGGKKTNMKCCFGASKKKKKKICAPAKHTVWGVGSSCTRKNKTKNWWTSIECNGNIYLQQD